MPLRPLMLSLCAWLAWLPVFLASMQPYTTRYISPLAKERSGATKTSMICLMLSMLLS